MIPKTHAYLLRVIVNDRKMRGKAVLYFILPFMIYTWINFYGAKDNLCLLVHPKQCPWRLYSILQLSHVVVVKSNGFALLTKSVPAKSRVEKLQSSIILVL